MSIEGFYIRAAFDRKVADNCSKGEAFFAKTEDKLYRWAGFDRVCSMICSNVRLFA